MSGIPIILNTSFNLAGEPIVTRAVEGYSTFRRCGIDVLVAGRHFVTKRGAEARATDGEDDARTGEPRAEAEGAALC